MKVSATVILTVKVTQNGTWENGSLCSQVFDQAGTEATNALRRLIDSTGRMTVIGKPVVTVVMGVNGDE